MGQDGAAMDRFDVVIIGGGVLGTAIAARLAKTSASVCVLEKESDVCDGASKGNAGVAVSYYGPPGTQETDLINLSNPGWEGLCVRLNVPYRRMGAVMVALDDVEEARLDHTLGELKEAGVRGQILSPREVLEQEPLVTDKARAGLLMPDEGVIDPIALTVAYANLAVLNGATLRLSSPVLNMQPTEDGTRLDTASGAVYGRYVINAAGVFAGHISQMAGGEDLHYWPRQGQYAVLDRVLAGRLNRIVFCTHSETTKGINVVPTTHGSALLGPTARNREDADDKATETLVIEDLVCNATRLVPAVRSELITKTFAANRPASDEQHRLRFDTQNPRLMHVTNRSAGVSLSPAAADLALHLLRDAGLEAAERPDALDTLPAVPRLRPARDPAELIKTDPAYGQVVCACEHVSAAEINHSLTMPVPATSVDGVRKRTGAAYGRCQGSLCAAGITFMTAMATKTGPSTVHQTSRGALGT